MLTTRSVSYSWRMYQIRVWIASPSYARSLVRVSGTAAALSNDVLQSIYQLEAEYTRNKKHAEVIKAETGQLILNMSTEPKLPINFSQRCKWTSFCWMLLGSKPKWLSHVWFIMYIYSYGKGDSQIVRRSILFHLYCRDYITIHCFHDASLKY